MLEFVRLARADGVLPRGNHVRKVVRVDGVRTAPAFQVFERSAELLQDLTVDVLDLARRRHDRDETRDGLDDRPKGLFRRGAPLLVPHTRILGFRPQPGHCREISRAGLATPRAL